MSLAVIVRRFHEMPDGPKRSSTFLDGDVLLVLQAPGIYRIPSIRDQQLSRDLRETLATQPLAILGLESFNCPRVGDLVELSKRAAPRRPLVWQETTKAPLLIPTCNLFDQPNIDPRTAHTSAGAAGVSRVDGIAVWAVKRSGKDRGERCHDPHLVTA